MDYFVSSQTLMNFVVTRLSISLMTELVQTLCIILVTWSWYIISRNIYIISSRTEIFSGAGIDSILFVICDNFVREADSTR